MPCQFSPMFEMSAPMDLSIIHEVDADDVSVNTVLIAPEPGPSSAPGCPTPVPSEDTYDDELTASKIAMFYEDLRKQASTHCNIRVTFSTPRNVLYNLCTRCTDKFLFCSNTWIYYDRVNFNDDCFREGYFCMFCSAKLYVFVN